MHFVYFTNFADACHWNQHKVMVKDTQMHSSLLGYWMYNNGVPLDSLSLLFNDVSSDMALKAVCLFGAAC